MMDPSFQHLPPIKPGIKTFEVAEVVQIMARRMDEQSRQIEALQNELRKQQEQRKALEYKVDRMERRLKALEQWNENRLRESRGPASWG